MDKDVFKNDDWLEKTSKTKGRKLEGDERLNARKHGADPDKVFIIESDISESQKKFEELLVFINKSEKIHNILNSTLIKDIAKCFIESITHDNKENDFSYLKDTDISYKFSSEFASRFNQGFFTHYSIDPSIIFNNHLKLDEKLSNESKKSIENNAEKYLKGIKPFECHDFIAYYIKRDINWSVSYNLRGLEKIKTQYMYSTPETIQKMEEEKLQWEKNSEKFKLINQKIDTEKPELNYQMLNVYFVGYCTYEMFKLETRSD
jgi:hypothetical protein